MSLKIRKYYLKQLNKKFKGKKINDLMYEVKIPDNLFHNIKSSTINYVSRCFNDNEIITEENELIKKIISKSTKLSNLTPHYDTKNTTSFIIISIKHAPEPRKIRALYETLFEVI